MTSSQHKTTIPPLDAAEIRIIKRADIPPVFAQFLKEKSVQLSIAFALRVSGTPHRYLMPAAPKPIIVKAKTGNWSFTKGIIAVESTLGCIEEKDGKWQLMQRATVDIPQSTDILQSVLHRISLQEVLAGIKIGEYELLGDGADIQKTGRITVFSHKHPYNQATIFSVNLLETKPRLQQQCLIDFSKIIAVMPQKEEKPAWWNDAWGEFETCLTHYYPAQYKHANDPNFRDIFVYGVADETGAVLPITGDQDLLWISTPGKDKNGIVDEFSEVINTLSPGGVEKLYRARLALHLKLGGQEDTAQQAISNSSIAGLGCVTAYESYVIDEVNKAFANAGIKHLRNLIQHAAENHNPNEPSSLDSKMVHIWQGKISVTINEHELIQFFMQPQFPRENRIQIHPKWDMRKWSSAIYMQLVLKQSISPDTMRAYKDFRNKQSRVAFFATRLPTVKNIPPNKEGANE